MPSRARILNFDRSEVGGDEAVKAELKALIAASQLRLLELHQELRETERQLEDALAKSRLALGCRRTWS